LLTSDLTAGTIRTDWRGIEQVFVPAGSFIMGSDPARDPDAQKDEQPAHLVWITRAFWLDRYPVTNAAYALFVADGGYDNPYLWTEGGWRWRTHQQNTDAPPVYDGFDAPDQPRVGLSRYEMIAYAKWRKAFLPTEAQWEYAARGPESLIYPWGNEYDLIRFNSERHIDKTTPVDRYPNGVSWCGAFDMVGNVWQMTADWYDVDYYKRLVQDDPQGVTFAEMRNGRTTWRGGRHVGSLIIRAATRIYSVHFERRGSDPGGGFRLSLVIPLPVDVDDRFDVDL